jgi:hypothetical protein
MAPHDGGHGGIEGPLALGPCSPQVLGESPIGPAWQVAAHRLQSTRTLYPFDEPAHATISERAMQGPSRTISCCGEYPKALCRIPA